MNYLLDFLYLIAFTHQAWSQLLFPRDDESYFPPPTRYNQNFQPPRASNPPSEVSNPTYQAPTRGVINPTYQPPSVYTPQIVLNPTYKSSSTHNPPSIFNTPLLQMAPTPSLEDIVSSGLTKLTLDINRVVPAVVPGASSAESIVYGPVTIAGALALVLLGSIGSTFNEIANMLGLSSAMDLYKDPFDVQEQLSKVFEKIETKSRAEQSMNFATAVFVQNDFPIRSVYQQASNDLYKSDVVNVDFRRNPQRALTVINRWVSDKTNSKIPFLLDEVPPLDTKAIITSVFYFKAAWETPFYRGSTQWYPFYTNGRNQPSDRDALMMSNGGEFPYHKDHKLGVQIMGFPYEGNATTMYVILPDQSNRQKLQSLENSLTSNDIEHLVRSTRYTNSAILFPRMKLESTINLRPALQRLGVSSLFNPSQANLALLSEGSNPQGVRFGTSSPAIPSFNRPEEDMLIFSRMGSGCTQIFDPIKNSSHCEEVPLLSRSKAASLDALRDIRRQVTQKPAAANPGLYADEVIHKVFIDITESGTEAAAATAAGTIRSGDRVTIFRLDVPFLFFIYHEDSKVILFWGSVKSPTPNRRKNEN